MAETDLRATAQVLADRIADEFYGVDRANAAKLIEAALAAVQQEERERCAQIAAGRFIPGHSVAGPSFTEGIADAIRSGV